jgi:hypothetical protein
MNKRRFISLVGAFAAGIFLPKEELLAKARLPKTKSWVAPAGLTKSLLRGGVRASLRVDSGLLIAGVTRDYNLSPLGGCTVHLFRTADDFLIETVVSDTDGNYEFHLPRPAKFYYVIAHKSLKSHV